MNDQLSRQKEREEFHAVKEEWAERFSEKNSALEIASFKYDTLMNQVEALREEGRLKEEQLDSRCKEVKILEEELQLKEKLIGEYQDSKHRMQRLQSDKAAAEARYDELCTAYETARAKLGEEQLLARSLGGDVKRMERDMETCRRRAEAVEDMSRENERLKLKVANISNECSSMEHKLRDAEDDVVRLGEELGKAQVKDRIQAEKLKDAEDVQQALHDAKVSSEQALGYEKERNRGMERTCEDLRSMLTSLQGDLEKCHETIALAEERNGADLASVCATMFNSLSEWEVLITMVLEVGHFFFLLLSSLLTFGFISSLSFSSNFAQGSLPVAGGGDSAQGTQHTALTISEMPSIELVKKVSANTERMDGKIARLVKLRKTFDSQSGKLLQSYTDKLSTAQDKVGLLGYRAANLETKLTSAHMMLERESKSRDADSADLMHFKDSVLAGCKSLVIRYLFSYQSSKEIEVLRTPHVTHPSSLLISISCRPCQEHTQGRG